MKQIATPSVVRKVLRLKSERPSLFASEIREALVSQRLCDPAQVPSVSSINRILREAASATSSLAAEWPAALMMAGHHQHHHNMMQNLLMQGSTSSAAGITAHQPSPPRHLINNSPTGNF